MAYRSSSRGSGRLVTRLDTPPFSNRHHPLSAIALFEMTQHLKDLGSDADRLNVVFVTVDPERDTPELLKTYMESFDPRIVALTGTPEEVAAAAKAFRVAYRKVPTEGGSYTMEHTASVIVTDAQGGFVSLIDYHEDKATALAKLKRAIRG